MKSTVTKFLMLILVFLLAFPFHFTLASSDESEEIEDPNYVVTENEVKDLQTKNDFEAVISSFFLGVGDYAQDYLNQVFREEITVDKIVYNKAVLLNANFFNRSMNTSQSNASSILRQIITKWFEYFRKINKTHYT